MRVMPVLMALLSLDGAAILAAVQTRHVELDHVFIVVQPGAEAEVEALRSAGFSVDTRRSKHDGQGTASVGVLFENAYLELIWRDPSVSIDPDHENTSQWFDDAAAWRTSGHSPFGLGLRRRPGDTTPLPVPVEREPAEWLEPGAAYELLRQPGDSLAADLFVVPPISALPSWIGRVREEDPAILEHPGGGREITLVRLHGPPEQEPRAIVALQPGRLEMVRGPEPLLELHLDAGRQERVDLRPILPLVVVR